MQISTRHGTKDCDVTEYADPKMKVLAFRVEMSEHWRERQKGDASASK
jgi:hypothetical protein